jgi:hypothetical protein
MKLILLAFSILIASFSSTVAQAEVEAYDAKGHYIGVFLGTDVTPTTTLIRIYIPSLKATISLVPSEDRTTADLPGSAVFFEEGDCSGVAYLPRVPYKYVLKASYAYPPQYYVPDTQNPETIYPASFQDENGCHEITSPLPFTEWFRLLAIQLPFTLPISLPLEFKQSGGTEKTKTVVIPLQ